MIFILLDKYTKILYTPSIIKQTSTSNYSSQNQKGIVLDIAENLNQIGTWTIRNFIEEKHRIDLYLKLTRKNFDALTDFPMEPDFQTGFRKICKNFTKLETQYKSGIDDHVHWAKGIIALGSSITETANLI